MAIGNEGIPAVMNVTPTNGNYNNGGWGGDWASWIILFLIFGMFGWGGFGGFGGGFGVGNGGAYATESILQRQLDTQTIVSKLDGINNGLCDGFYATQGAINGLGVTVMQGNNALQAQLASCCCGLERAIDGVRYDNAQNTCSILNTINTSTRDIVDNANSNTRAILDYLCQDKIQTLQAENQALRLSASQSAQNATLMAAMDANKAEILRRTGAECPTAAYIVQPPQPVSFPTNCCGQFNGFGNGFNGCGNCGNC